MKALLITSLVVGVVIAISYFGGKLEQLGTTNYTAPQLEVIEEVVVTEERDVIAKAKADLERITAELDAEEVELLRQRDLLDARLEEIRKTRSSF